MSTSLGRRRQSAVTVRRRGSPRYEWKTAHLGQTGVAPGTAITGVIFPPATFATEVTQMRLRGRAELNVGALTGPSYFFWGLMWLTPDGLGGTPLLNPFDQPDASWLYFSCGTLNDYGGGHRYLREEVDSKAMRKVNSEMALVYSVANLSLSAAAIGFSVDFRVLVKEA